MHPLQQVNGMNHLYYTDHIWSDPPVCKEHLLHKPLYVVGTNRVLNLIAVRPVIHCEASPSEKRFTQLRLLDLIHCG